MGAMWSRLRRELYVNGRTVSEELRASKLASFFLEQDKRVLTFEDFVEIGGLPSSKIEEYSNPAYQAF